MGVLRIVWRTASLGRGVGGLPLSLTMPFRSVPLFPPNAVGGLRTAFRRWTALNACQMYYAAIAGRGHEWNGFRRLLQGKWNICMHSALWVKAKDGKGWRQKKERKGNAGGTRGHNRVWDRSHNPKNLDPIVMIKMTTDRGTAVFSARIYPPIHNEVDGTAFAISHFIRRLVSVLILLSGSLCDGRCGRGEEWMGFGQNPLSVTVLDQQIFQ